MLDPAVRSSRLPPYGWAEWTTPKRTVLRGWDWAMGAVTLVHGHATLPLAMHCIGGIKGFGLWLAASLVVAGGTGWRLIIDQRGFLFSWTWFGLPLTWRRLAVGTPFAVDEDLWAATELAQWARLGSDDHPKTCEFGSAVNATAVVSAIRDAVERHHFPIQRATSYRESARTAGRGS